MNVLYNYSNVTVSSLKEHGFEFNMIDEPYGKLTYNGDVALIRVTEYKNELYLSDIAQERGINPFNVVKKLYEIYDLKLVSDMYLNENDPTDETTFEQTKKMIYE